MLGLEESEGAAPCVSLVELRDGRLFVGVLKSFDHYGNLLLDHASERLLARNVKHDMSEGGCQEFPVAYADLYLGCMLIRGENIALFARDEVTPLEAYLSDLHAAAESPELYAHALEARALRAEELFVKLPLSTILYAQEESKERKQHAAQVWAEYSKRLQSLPPESTMETSFVRTMLLNSGKAGGESFTESEMVIIKGLFERYIANAKEALATLSEEECDFQIDA